MVAVVVLARGRRGDAPRRPGLFSPGELNAQTSADPPDATAKAERLGGVTSHAQIGDDCGACHPAPWSSRTMADACLDCHTDIAEEIAAKDGMHGRLKGMQTSPTCAGCHPEHNGPSGSLTALDEASFRSAHDMTGFSLKSHRETESAAASPAPTATPRTGRRSTRPSAPTATPASTPRS